MRTTSVFLVVAMTALPISGCGKQASDASDNQLVRSTTVRQLSPPPGKTWTAVVNATDDGFVMGNPDAPVKLTEIASLGCPYCKRFDDDGVPALKERVATGKLSWEFRPYIIHGPVDLAANLIARCNGSQRFFPMVEALYKGQLEWMGKAEKAPPASIEKMQTLPPTQAIVEMARLAGLQQFAAQRGLPTAKANQCLSDQAAIAHEVAVVSNVANEFPGFNGTPGFAINGKFVPGVNSWNALKPALDDALN